MTANWEGGQLNASVCFESARVQREISQGCQIFLDSIYQKEEKNYKVTRLQNGH
jgi:hypothetical protein